MKPRISMITLGVKDLKRSIKFYESGLGFSRKNTETEIAIFKLNGSWLSLYNLHSLAEDANVSSEGNGFNGFTISHNVKSEDEVDKVFDNAISVGAKLIKSPQEVFWGGYSGYFADPDRYLWEIAYNPHSWIGPED